LLLIYTETASKKPEIEWKTLRVSKQELFRNETIKPNTNSTQHHQQQTLRPDNTAKNTLSQQKTLKSW